MSDDSKRMEKILFSVDAVDDWPPVRGEYVWALTTSATGEFRVQNSPFFVRGIAWGDTVIAKPNAQGTFEVSEKVADGGHYTLRIVLAEKSSAREVLTFIQEIGGHVERSDYPELFSIDLPDEDAYRKALAVLKDWRSQGKLGVEEAKAP